MVWCMYSWYDHQWSQDVSRWKTLKMQTKSQSTFDCRFFRLNYWWMPCMMVSQRCRRVRCNPISIGLQLQVICPTWLCLATRVLHGHNSSQWRLNNTIAMACYCCRTCSRSMLVLFWNSPSSLWIIGFGNMAEYSGTWYNMTPAALACVKKTVF